MTKSTGLPSLPYTLTLDAPAVLSASAAGQWLSHSDGHVHGGAILGAAAARWLQGAGHSGDTAHEDEDFRRLFLDGSTFFLNAYPLDSADDSRLLPLPLSMEEDRDSPGVIVDRAAGDDEDTILTRRPQGGFASVRGTTITLHDAARSLRYHHQRSRLHGRPTEQTGFFSYESIDEGQRFGGVIVGEEEDLESIRTLLGDAPLSLGRSRSAAYGGAARLDFGALGEPEVCAEAVPHRVVEEPRVVLTLTAPMLARDRATGGYGGLPLSELGERFRAAGVFVTDEMLGAALSREFVRTVVVGGYVRKWNLPRPQWRALAPGSVFVFSFRDLQLSEAQRAAIVQRGLGERTTEGFGRFVLDWHGTESRLQSHLAQPRISRPAATPPVAYGRIVMEAHRAAVEQALRQLARTNASTTSRPPSKSLCARAERLLRDLPVSRHGSQIAFERLESMPKASLEQLAASRLSSHGRLSAHLLDTLRNPSALMRLDKIAEAGGFRREIDRLRAAGRWYDAGREAELRHVLARVYLVELLGALRRRSRA